MVTDEAQVLENLSAKGSVAVLWLAAYHYIMLTATPIANGAELGGLLYKWKSTTLEEREVGKSFFDILNSFEEPKSCVGRHCHEEVPNTSDQPLTAPCPSVHPRSAAFGNVQECLPG